MKKTKPTKVKYAEITIDNNLTPTITPVATNEKFASRVGLVANTHRTIIRTKELTSRRPWLTSKTKWQLVKDSFPLGLLLSGDTHIFDGTVIQNNQGNRCFLMVAFPKAISESVAELAVEKWGSVHKIHHLDAVEHMLFKHFARRASAARDANNQPIQKPQWIVFPQGLGFRILFLENGLPVSAYRVSNQLGLREDELRRVMDVALPEDIVMLSRKPNDTSNEIYSDGAWMEAILQSRGDVNVSYEDFTCLSQFAR